ncbi:ATP phosphoribosyltransferase regulatory subunit [Psychrobacter sp. LV10R520-6]|uniref:ATP phosphoribosyltransferase regulatory subunit n=1 Tax=Psychrobacter sp. LV10R520-6 TaxID=1415574 RepID=UPI0024C63A8D|nr:ATP phosphoribosyltransferase regulatory subunit [Psychrobacter sp. LV10R520-6]SNT69338.1 ATP phosphoribosyltransferase regulatory subunit [Psychrobacter sp. LV10R520-6]
MSVSSDSANPVLLSSTNKAAATMASGHPDNSPVPNRLSYLSSFAAEVANSWLLPDGVADVLFDDAQKQEVLRHELTQQLITYGYQLVCPPMIEFTESLLSDASEDLKRQTFKIIDQLTGRLMGVRADITPQILRIDAHHGGTGIARYCYAGDVIHTLPSGLFGSRTPLQLGAEIFGCAELSADIELTDVLFAMIDSLNMSAAIHVDLGHVAIFKRLAVLAQLSDIDTEQLMHLYANKNLPELKRVSQALPMGEDFYVLAHFGHDMAQLLSKLSATAQKDSHIAEAVDELQRLKMHLQNQWQCQVSIDVTELSGYHYHTGIVFNGYINNETQPLVRGGRFDGLQSDSKQSRAATGFSMDVSRLLAHIQLDQPTVVVVDYTAIKSAADNADSTQMQALQQQVDSLRQQGYRVTMPLDAHDCPVGVTHRLSMLDNLWQLQTV